MPSSHIYFAHNEAGMKACEKFYREYDARVEELYSKQKITAEECDEWTQSEVDLYNWATRNIIEDKVMDEMIAEEELKIGSKNRNVGYLNEEKVLDDMDAKELEKNPNSFLKRLKQKLLILLKNLM